MQWCEDFIVEAVRQYQQLMEKGSQTQGLELQAPSHAAETTLLPIPSALDSLTVPLQEHQTDAGEDSAALAKTLMAELQAMMPFLERWQKYLEANALLGTLHPYPKRGVRWNYYPQADEVKKAKISAVMSRKKILRNIKEELLLGTT